MLHGDSCWPTVTIIKGHLDRYMDRTGLVGCGANAGRWDECRWDILDELTALCDTAAASLLVLLLLLAMGTTVYIFNRDLSNARGKGGEGKVKFLILHSACPYQTLVFSLQTRHGNKPFSTPAICSHFPMHY